MFGTNKYKQQKKERFLTEKERKRYFAIKNYYIKKNSTNDLTIITTKKTKQKK